MIRENLLESLADKAGYEATRLAKLCGVSLRSLQRFFIHRYHLRVSEWLQRIRFSRAYLRILSGHRIKIIALDLGFKQLSSFSRGFKDRFGIAPSRLLSESHRTLLHPASYLWAAAMMRPGEAIARSRAV